MSEKILFNDNWLFHRGEIPLKEPHYKGASYMQAKTERMLIGPAAFAYNDRAEDYRISACYTDERWDIVNLPHDYVIHQTPDETHNNGLGYFLYENAWYRKHFTLAEEDKKRRIAVYFGSVTTACEVFCNGVPVGKNETGNTPFEIDLTDFVWFDRENVLAVHVIADRHESWWYEGAGICRNVYLIRSDMLFIPTDGILVRCEKKGETLWRVRVEAEVQNDTLDNENADVKAVLAPVGGNAVLELSSNITVQAFEGGVAVMEGELADPQIWDLDSPNLYTVTVSVSTGEKERDRASCRTGFRTFETRVSGFYLNGRKVPVYGVNCHGDAGLFGHAIPDNVPKYKLALLKEMGCNAVRCSHYMQSDIMMDAMDEMGFIVMAETRWYHSGPEGLKQLSVLLRRDRNRPSVFFWSLGNEEPRHRTELGVRMLRRMRALVRKLDPTRPVTSAFCAKTEAAPVMAEVDVIGINYNHEDYDACRAKYPDKPIIATETSATSTTRGWYRDDSRERGYYSAYDKDTTPLFRSREFMMRFFASRNDVMGLYQWDGFEHRGECVWPRLCSQAGAIDLFLQRKDAFYQNKSHFSDEPMLHVLPHWNLPLAPGATVPVVAYTTGDAAECWLGDTSCGRLTLKRYEAAKWTVPYDPARELRVVAYKDGAVIAEKHISRTGRPVALRLAVDLPVSKANGRDVVLLSCYAVDENGVDVPDAAPTVSFSANRLGTVVATGSDVCDHVCVDSPTRRMRAGVISVAVRVGTLPGELRVYAESEGLIGVSAALELK